ncbi:hypothetical protein N0V95_005867 [Ascochyta clinopodiicola]|nr:hypothetical protein N0V95_005867 [Ascochyta clinopodiicola]
MALRSCCWNIELFLPETLEHPGWHYAGMIYRHLKTTDTLTFTAWTLFQTAYPTQPDLTHAFRIPDPDLRTWPSIVKSLSLLPSGVLTRFCASGMDLDLQQLLSLVDIPTLAALVQVRDSRDGKMLSEVSVRAWCRAVREKQALRTLKLLVLDCVSDASLRHLEGFPALRLVGVARARSAGRREASGAGGWWMRPGSVDEEKFTRTMSGSICSIAEKMERLYGFAEGLLPLEEGVGDLVTLSLTCAAAAEPRMRSESIAWFVRDSAAEDTLPLDAPATRDASERATKKRKVRLGKQQDVASLLGSFG